MNQATPDSTSIQEIMCRIVAQQNLRGIVYCEMTQEQKLTYASHCAHALMVEGAELSSSWAFAPWKSTPVDRENIKREVVDCIFFLVNICGCFDIESSELMKTFEWVLKNNARRMENGEHKSMESK